MKGTYSQNLLGKISFKPQTESKRLFKTSYNKPHLSKSLKTFEKQKEHEVKLDS